MTVVRCSKMVKDGLSVDTQPYPMGQLPPQPQSPIVLRVEIRQNIFREVHAAATRPLAAANFHFHVRNTPIQAHIMTAVASHPIAFR
jgi:hypothetical protein